MRNLTPKELVAQLDKYIIGQQDAKRAVAVAIRNRWRRMQVQDDGMRTELTGKNILMMGPTGVGKTEIARRLATLTGAPFIKVEATKFTEVGYHGRDVDSMIRDLLDVAISLMRAESQHEVKESAEKQVEERLLDYLFPMGPIRHREDETTEELAANHTREKLREKLRAGELEDREIEINVEQQASVVGILGNQAMEMDVEMQSMFEKMLPTRRETKRVKVRDARKMLFAQEADKLVDRDKIHRNAIERVEQLGIIFLDEIDKIASSGKESGPDVSRQGVQRDLLPIVEGSTVITKYGPVKTDHILFIAAGAFHQSKPSDLMPELQGRFPIRVELQDLTKQDFVRILREPQNSLTVQQVALLKTEGVDLTFTEDAVEKMAEIAFDLNKRTQNIGARRLYTIIERVLESLSFDAPDMKEKSVRVDAAFVTERLADVVKDEDLSQFIL
jgi:ATP-dependent HslUV protease ATP-binding subunit HslU